MTLKAELRAAEKEIHYISKLFTVYTDPFYQINAVLVRIRDIHVLIFTDTRLLSDRAHNFRCSLLTKIQILYDTYKVNK